MRLCANLPYNIATALLTRWIEAEPWPGVFDRYVLMFQKEVARRIVATPMQRADYGRLAVLCGWRTRARILFDVSPAAFTPAPKVTSSVVELTPLNTPLACSKQSLSRVTQAAFGQRRKISLIHIEAYSKDRNNAVVSFQTIFNQYPANFF